MIITKGEYGAWWILNSKETLFPLPGHFIISLHDNFFVGLTAIEAWMLACILFVFGALVEYAVILFRRQTSKDHVDPPSVRKDYVK